LTFYFLGLDGASINTIEESMTRIRLPSFEKLLKGGRVGSLRSVYPYVTAPAWSTIFSGVNPGKHGIFDMFKITKEGGVAPSNMACSRVPFLWDYLTWANKKTLAIGIPFVYPAPEINGVFISGRFAPSATCYPKEVSSKFDLSAFQYDHLSMEEKTVKLVTDTSERVSLKILEDLRKRVETTIQLIDSDSWDAIILVEGLPDDFLHISYGTDELVDQMYVELDNLVGLFLERVEKEDSLVIASDHGFRRVSDVFFLNEWLREKGYASMEESRFVKIMLSLGISWDRLQKRGFLSKAFSFAITHFPRLTGKTTRALTAGMVADQSSKLKEWKIAPFSINEPLAWLRISDNFKPSINLDSLIKELMELKEDGVLKRVFKTSEIYFGNCVQDAPGQILIEANDGWSIDTLRWNNKRQVGKPLLTKRGVHQRDGVIFLYGDFFEADLSSARIHDIVPTILSLMRLPLPDDLDGKSLVRTSEQQQGQPKIPTAALTKQH
jgi:predicted AlkP superfamily phosphohydrolase/phosphomutase